MKFLKLVPVALASLALLAGCKVALKAPTSSTRKR